MADESDDPAEFPRRLSKGRAFVYVIPCRGDTRFKIGFARDPIERWRSLHARFYSYFDLRQGLLLETTRVAEARAIEQRLLSQFSAFEAFAPLDVAAAAGGSSEWLRGVLDDVAREVAALATARALVLHRPASAWLRAHLLERRDLLFDWSARVFEQVEYERGHGAALPLAARALQDTLDAYAVVGIDLAGHLPAAVARWQMRREKDEADPA